MDFSTLPPFERLVAIMAKLRAPDGCPWDLKQTHQSLKPYLIEEAYEVLEAIDDDDPQEFCAELGDLMLQVVFHAQLAKEAERFNIDDVATAICDKLIRRHPHVFGDVVAEDSETVLKNWEQLKMEERREKAKPEKPASVLDGVPKVLPGLLKSQRIQEKAARVGFDWNEAAEVLEKIDEETEELREALAEKSKAEQTHELGDLLFAIANLGRHIGLDAEQALEQANKRFTRRFQHMEAQATLAGKELADYEREELEALWAHAKHRLADSESPEIGEAPQLF